MEKQFCIGMDLGTSNSAMAWGQKDQGDIEVLDISQVCGAGKIGELKTLPSALYFFHDSEKDSVSNVVPWEQDPEIEFIIGSYARERGSLLTERLVTSAKSWLCNDQVNRASAILPWDSESVPNKLSPVEVSGCVLRHLKETFNYQKREDGRIAESDQCQVVITVPASFDEVARALTYEAAQQAGFHDIVLLEEPLAAFYSWIAGSEGNWRDQVKPGDIILVCDVGGGTADFSLIAISESKGSLQLDRISVGKHILLGGDNMDLALGLVLQGQLRAVGHQIDRWQFLSLVHGARLAKERMLSDKSVDAMTISVQAKGSSLFANTLSTKLTREVLYKVILEGFFPILDVNVMPEQNLGGGLHEYGLPFESDAVLSKHLAQFLTWSLENVRSDHKLSKLLDNYKGISDAPFLCPTAVLFNGGVFQAPLLRTRVLDLLKHWNQGADLRELKGADLDLAVARGAAYYGRSRIRNEEFRIRSGTARSYYIGLETSMPAVPGYKPPVKGLCIVPQGMDEGSKFCLEAREFGLAVGTKVEFRFFSSTTRAGDHVGTVIDDAELKLDELSHLEITLSALEGRQGEVVPVRIESVMTELGILELWMQHVDSEQRWKLEFNVRNID